MFPTVLISLSAVASTAGALLAVQETETSQYNNSVRSGCPEWDQLPIVYNKKFIGGCGVG